MSTSRSTFTAVYDGHCTECGDDIFEGDDIAYYDDEIVCGDCFVVLTDDGSDDSDDW